jgi:DNA-binding LacI/PurR family transcriptional regulator
MKARPTTLRDLAVKLGVSHATVSLALRNHPRISEATRERVKKLAREMNYRGNILVSALLSQVRSRRVNSGGEVIGLLLTGKSKKRVATNTEGVEAAKMRAEQTGLKAEVFLLGERGADSASVGRVLYNRGIRGLIIAPMPLDLLPLEFDWNTFAVVAVGYSFRQQQMHRVANGHFGGILEVYARLRAAGHERIGCVLRSNEDTRARHYWLAGALAAPQLHGGSVHPPLMLDDPPDEIKFEQWFRKERPDAIIGNHPDYVLSWLKQRGLCVPRDVSYASLDIVAGSGVSGMRQAWADVFSTAVDLLAGELARNEFGLPSSPKNTLIDGTWIDGLTIKYRNT